MTKRTLVPLLALVWACSTAPAIPPGDYALQPTPVPAGAPDSGSSRVTRLYSAGAGQSRYAITARKGTYFLWIQKPSVAFFIDFPGEVLESAPQFVYMVFRTQDPQGLEDNKLQLSCDGAATAFDGLPGSKVVPGIFHNAHYLTFELPRETFGVLAHCATGEVAVGGVSARLSGGQLQGLRDLEATFPSP